MHRTMNIKLLTGVHSSSVDGFYMVMCEVEVRMLISLKFV
jgi:hypothetical protein